jgi:hypothetical protein
MKSDEVAAEGNADPDLAARTIGCNHALMWRFRLGADLRTGRRQMQDVTIGPFQRSRLEEWAAMEDYGLVVERG